MLQQLVQYAEKHLADSEPGFTTRNVRWLIELSVEGKMINMLPIGDDRGEQVSKCPDMHGMNAGGRAHFLVESLQTVALHFRNNESEKNIVKTQKRHAFYVDLLKQAVKTVPDLRPLSKLIENEKQLQGLRARCVEHRATPSDWVRWRIADTDPLKLESVLNWWRAWLESDQSKSKLEKKTEKGKQAKVITAPRAMICFLTGAETQPLATQPKVTGLSGVGGLGTGDVMVGFDKDAFCSFGFEQASNAAMSAKGARAYVDALNHLIANHSRMLAGAKVVHWFKKAVKPEDDPLSFLFEPPGLTEAAAQSSARKLLESLRTGQRPFSSNNHYFAMTISGAAGRVMVRDWMEGSFEELVGRIEKWFADLEIVARDSGELAPDPKFMAVCGAIMRDLKDLPAPTATALWRVALAGLPIPQPFIALALARFRADLIDDKPFNHARMGLIKAYFVRKGGNQHMSAYLNKEHPEPAYHCGRLLALLARLQRAALGDVGAGVVQRYYVAASVTPGLTLGRLVGNAKNHLNKLEGGLTFWYEEQIAEIMSRIKDRIPATLDLEHQSLFALGYYQQIADRGNKNTKSNETNEGGN